MATSTHFIELLSMWILDYTHSLTHHRSLHYIKLKIFKVAKVITSGTTGCNKPDKLQYIVRMRLSKPMCRNDDDDDFCR